MTEPQAYGKELDSVEHWEAEASTYEADVAKDRETYHEGRLATAERLLPGDTEGGRVLDFGCGNGAFSSRLASRDYDVHGVDVSPRMVDLATAASTDVVYQVAEAQDLLSFEQSSYEGVVSLNVLAYLTDEELCDFWSGVRHVLAPNGWLLVSHSNELFDLFALNSGTASFFSRHFTENREIASLLSQPGDSRPTYNVRANPLTYREVLASEGFSEERHAFFNFHPLPPMLLGSGDEGRVLDPEEIAKVEPWKQMFQCSTYFSLSRRTADQPPNS